MSSEACSPARATFRSPATTSWPRPQSPTGSPASRISKIGAYEHTHENRTTVLAKVGALPGTEPWPGYDELTVDEIKKLTAMDTADARKEVRRYERAHKDRSTVISATER